MMTQPDDPGPFERLCLCCLSAEGMGSNRLCVRCMPEPEAWWAHVLRLTDDGRPWWLRLVVRRVMREARSLGAWLGGEK